MKFYCLHEGYYEGVQLRLDQLEAACQKLGVEFVAMNNLEVDYSTLPTLTKTDLLYNATRGCETLETLLLNNEVTTFYINTPDLVVTNPDTTKYTVLHDKANLPAPKTIFSITTDRDLLKKYVDYLGGFPIIIKVAGSSRGIGTMKIETWQNLISTVDYLTTTGDRFIMREFIVAKGVGRCRVLGNSVIQTFEDQLLKGDFRNASTAIENIPPSNTKDYSDIVKQDCIKACHLANLEFGSVDVLLDENGKHYILEVNFPTGLPSIWQENNFVAINMIDYLIKKSNAK